MSTNNLSAQSEGVVCKQSETNGWTQRTRENIQLASTSQLRTYSTNTGYPLITIQNNENIPPSVPYYSYVYRQDTDYYHNQKNALLQDDNIPEDDSPEFDPIYTSSNNFQVHRLDTDGEQSSILSKKNSSPSASAFFVAPHASKNTYHPDINRHDTDPIPTPQPRQKRSYSDSLQPMILDIRRANILERHDTDPMHPIVEGSPKSIEDEKTSPPLCGGPNFKVASPIVGNSGDRTQRLIEITRTNTDVQYERSFSNPRSFEDFSETPIVTLANRLDSNKSFDTEGNLTDYEDQENPDNASTETSPAKSDTGTSGSERETSVDRIFPQSMRNALLIERHDTDPVKSNCVSNPTEETLDVLDRKRQADNCSIQVIGRRKVPSFPDLTPAKSIPRQLGLSEKILLSRLNTDPAHFFPLRDHLPENPSRKSPNVQPVDMKQSRVQENKFPINDDPSQIKVTRQSTDTIDQNCECMTTTRRSASPASPRIHHNIFDNPTNIPSSLQEDIRRQIQIQIAGSLGGDKSENQAKQEFTTSQRLSEVFGRLDSAHSRDSETREVSKWTEDDVGAWLESIGCGAYVNIFEAEEVDGVALLEITEGDLKELGMTLGKRKRFMKHVRKIRQSRKMHRRFSKTDISSTLSRTTTPDPVEVGQNLRMRVDVQVKEVLHDGSLLVFLNNVLFRIPHHALRKR